MEPMGQVGIRGGVGSGERRIDPVEGASVRPAAGEGFHRELGLAEPLLRDVTEPVGRAFGLEQEALDHRVGDQARHADAVRAQHLQVELGVVRDLADRRILEQRREQRHGGVQIEVTRWIRAPHGHVHRFPCLHAGAEADHARRSRRPLVGLGIEGQHGAIRTRGTDGLDPCGERLDGREQRP